MMEPRVLLSRLLDSARKRGAMGAEALLAESRSLSIRYFGRELNPGLEERSTLLRFRVYLAGGRTARAELRSPNIATLEPRISRAVGQAVARARKAHENPFAGPTELINLGGLGLSLLDRRQANLNHLDRTELVLENASGCEGVDSDIHLVEVTYREGTRTRYFASSRGAMGIERSSTFTATARARHRAGDRTYSQTVSSRYFANIASMPFGVELGRRLRTLHTPATMPEHPLPMFIQPHVSAQIFASMAPAFVSRTVKKGKSFISQRLGKPIASPKLHVIDDPGLPGALGSRAFDDRGVPPVPVVIIREGIASSLFFDVAEAREADLRPTGHFMDGMMSCSNLVMRSGTRSRNAMGMDIGDYLVLENFHKDLPVNPTTGLLDSPCDVLVCSDNAVVGAVRNAHMRIHASELLGAIREVTSDQARHGNVDACSMIVEGPLPQK